MSNIKSGLWVRAKICPGCFEVYHYTAHFDGCCPKCGHPGDGFGNLTDWRKEIVRWRPSWVWWNPLTWGLGSWEIRVDPTGMQNLTKKECDTIFNNCMSKIKDHHG